jgi:hypothetical protein
MTDQPIHNLDMTDTEYCSVVARGYDPKFERGLVEVFGEDSAKKRKLTRFIGLLKTVSPETDQEWKNAMGAWDDVCLQYDSDDSK